MSERRALRFVNETEGEKEMRRFHYTIGFYAIVTLVCVIITAGGTYSWGQTKEQTEEETTTAAAIVPATVEITTENEFKAMNLHYIEVISGTIDEPIRECENSLYESVPLDDEYKLFVIEKCVDMGISPAVVFAMMYHESRYQADTVGDGGNSLGILQVQPRWHSERMKRLGCYDLLDFYQNVTVALDYLGELLERYDGDLMKALTAYNRGHYDGVVTNYAYLVTEEAERIGEEA